MFDKKEYQKKWYEKNKDKRKECHKQWCEQNKDKVKEYNKQYYEENKNKVKERKEKYYEENNDKIKEYQKEYREQNKDKFKRYREQNKDKFKEIDKKWREKNKDKVNLISLKRRERKRNLNEKSFTHQHIKEIKQKFENKCFHCSKKEKLELDHFYPLSKGFSLTEDNCIILCKSCNTAKHNKDPHDFFSSEQINILKEKFKITIRSN